MRPLLVHYCNTCTYNTTIPFTASVFSQPNSCSYCGAVVIGINSRSKAEEEANMQQEELARLFQANLNLSQAPANHDAPTQPQQIAQEPAVQQQQWADDSPQNVQPITYASTHYTHSHHVVPSRNAPSTPTKTEIDVSELGNIFLRNSIDPSLLFPSQIDLFQNADDDQRLRLLELWRISPPQGRQGYPPGVDYNISRQLYDWPPTSLAQEEAMAKLRYERMVESNAQSESINSHEQHLNQSMDAAKESVSATQTQNDRTASPDAAQAEPYILSGYDMLARREYDESARAEEHPLRESNRYNQATDPVFNHPANNGGLWEKNVGSILDMENNYGAFAYAREHDIRPIYADEEMVM
ncbi:hypothetical protein BU24DRAFT_493267 [Aaosphaeria arxii CBS 175.79]|uniref:Uncharacterized protein n=1 Tax=Aaosphaeria arxii CBS 175.79 TaxID=1450172 RepID=A0A6A5XPF9_9PLEO|nr:uncharacterized protein BU24DRAFT_493267 [Aaosphaeria arxii CBS 175.79]KAF2014727.1 hypothetical protein BU24DRAFT_493267 [Aaosphaeria arxii CBS 175.79]